MLSRDDILAVLNEKEKVNYEFKAAKHAVPESIYETYSSFSNTNSGTIVLGIKETKVNKETTFEIIGVESAEAIITDLWNCLNNKQKVSLCLLEDEDVYTVEIDKDTTVVVIHVPRTNYDQKPIYIKGNPYTGTYKRNFEGDYRCDKETVNAMIRDAYTSSNDNEILDYFGLEDIDMDTLHAYRNRFRHTNEGHVYDDLNDLEFLTKMGAYRIDKRRNIEGLTRAGVLMFGKTETFNDLYNHVNFDYRNETNLYGDMRWSDRVIENGLWEKNIYNFITKVYPKVVSEFEVPFQMKDSLQRVDESKLHVAAREALANTIIHADYSENPCNILVIKKDDHVCYSNSGMLRMSIEEVLSGGRSLPRNATVQKLLRFIGFGESAGSGYDKILAPSKVDGYKVPVLYEREGIRATELKLWTVREKKVLDTPVIGLNDSAKLPKIQLAVYLAIKENPMIRKPKIAEICSLNDTSVKNALKALKDKGYVEYVGSKKEGGYKVK